MKPKSCVPTDEASVRDAAIRAIEAVCRRELGPLFGKNMIGWVGPTCDRPGEPIYVNWLRIVDERASIVRIYGGMMIRDANGKSCDATGLRPGWERVAAKIQEIEPTVRRAEIVEQLLFKFAFPQARRRAS